MKESREGIKSGRLSKSSSVCSLPLILDIDDFKGEFSFDALFGNLVNQLLPSFQEEETDVSEGHGNISASDGLSNGHTRAPSDTSKFAQGPSDPLFPEVDKILSLFKDSCKELIFGNRLMEDSTILRRKFMYKISAHYKKRQPFPMRILLSLFI